jgi:hypothetical protein
MNNAARAEMIADPMVRQISGTDPDGLPILSVIARRSYVVDDTGRLASDPTPSPLVVEAQPDPAQPDLLLADTDLWAYKPLTDVVVLGHAYGDQPSFRPQVRIGQWSASVQIHGPRRATLNHGGRVEFTPPTHLPDGKVALIPQLAYGGRDAVAEAELGNPLEPYQGSFAEPIDPAGMSPFLYQRNPWGRGYVVRPTRASVEAAELPLIEDIADQLTPERLIADRPARWLMMPLPAGTGWLPYAAFVRLANFRMIPHAEKPTSAIAEVARGWLPADILDPMAPTVADAFRLAQGSWPGWRVGPLAGGETITLDHLHPRCGRWSFTLPRRPDLRIDGRNQGKVIATKPVLSTVIIEPDAGRVTLVWRGSERAKRPYTEDELKRMPFLARFD